ncbi:hypothetical protein ScPMuIL_006231 [Solemya velum]
MATVDVWRTRLNDLTFCKKIRENNAKDSKHKLQTDAKRLLVVFDSKLFVWDCSQTHLIYFNLRNVLSEKSSTCSSTSNHYQTLLCTDSPKFDVECLVMNGTGSHIALWGPGGITVMELPQRWGKYAEYEGGKDTVSCRTITICEHYFNSQKGVILQVMWHPGSPTDTTLVCLTSNNLLSIFDIQEPERPSQVVNLCEYEPGYTSSPSKIPFSCIVGENAVAFDFGSPVELKKKQKPFVDQGAPPKSCAVWPVYLVYGNGDIYVSYIDVNSPRPLKFPVNGPLLMHPPAEDNYGNDACAISVLNTMPPVVVVATCEGRLHHCLLLSASQEETTLQSESSFRVSETSTIYESPQEVSLYVYETVELELSLSVPSLDVDGSVEDDFTCPIRLLADPSSDDRYHCLHSAGVHTVGIPWIHQYETFFSQGADDALSTESLPCILEHLVCTKPMPSSPPSPVLGLGVLSGQSPGTMLLALTSDYEFITLQLSTKYRCQDSSLLSTSSGQALLSPLRRFNREPFDVYIRNILARTSSNPLLRSSQNTEMSQQECFQLLSRTTQIFREEYIQKQDYARQELEKRVRILLKQKELQFQNVQELQESRNILRDRAQGLADKFIDCQEKQEDMLKRLEGLMRKFQARLPVLSEAERSMKRDLETMEEQLHVYQRSLDQLKMKRDFQNRQSLSLDKGSHSSPSLKSNQMKQLKEVIKHEGDELADLMKRVNSLRMESS